MDLELAIETILRDSNEAAEFDPRILGLDFEKRGTEAFDRTTSELRRSTVSEAGIVRGLRALALLTRQFAVERKPDLLEFSLNMMGHASKSVRSAALLTAVVTSTTAGKLGLDLGISWEKMRETIRRTLELGVDPDQDALGRQFLLGNGRLTQTVEK
jgi:hypothetical protein